MKKLLLIIAILTCSACSSEQKRIEDTLGKITNVAQIGTVEYTITKLVVADGDAFYKIGERKIIFSCKAIVKAGIDMKDFTLEDVKYDRANKTISVNLPSPSILSFNMPMEKIKCEFSKISGIRSDFNTEERNNLLIQGEQNIRADLENLGIIKDAKENAVQFFQTLLNCAGYKNVVVNFKEKKEA